MTIVEGSFAEAKLYRAHSRARWRGQAKMQIQCYLVAVAQNLKKLLTYGWKDGPNAIVSSIKPVIFALYSLGWRVRAIIIRMQTVT